MIGVTGSTGKTCTKDFDGGGHRGTAQRRCEPRVVQQRDRTAADPPVRPPGPRPWSARWARAGIGHIRALCDVARPQIGIVTNVGPAHLELFGTLENVVIAKGELVEALPGNGTAILNGDDPLVRDFDRRTPAARCCASVWRPGQTWRPRISSSTPSPAARASGCARPGARPTSTCTCRANRWCPTRWRPRPRPGAGVAGRGRRGPERGAVSGGRMQVVRTADGVTIVNDAYNANPTSMAAAALRARGRWPATGDGWPCSARWPSWGRSRRRSTSGSASCGGLDVERAGRGRPLGRGDGHGRRRRRTAEPAGAPHGAIPSEAGVVRSIMRPGDVVLVKASRVVGLRRIAEELGGVPAVQEVSGP